MTDALLTLNRRIAELELQVKRLERHNQELRAAIEALLDPSPVRFAEGAALSRDSDQL
jgi:chaperonin cofactor prefoldin